MSFDMTGFCRDVFRPGVRHIIDGSTGQGKTHTCVSLMQRLVQGDIDIGMKVVAITNIVMFRRVNGRLRVGYPPDVYPMGSFAAMLRRVGGLLAEHGHGRILVLMVLDEAQNYMLADLNAARENLAIIKFMANIRKFSICTVFLTPTRSNLAPKIRNFVDDPNRPGTCDVYWHKDAKAAERHVGKEWARSTALVKLGYEQRPFAVYVKSGSWTRPAQKLGEGEWGYDTYSCADLELGRNPHGVEFDLKAFLQAVSGVAHFDIPRRMGEYFAQWEATGTDPEDGEDARRLRLREQCARVVRMRGLGIKWNDIATIEGADRRTLQSRVAKHAPSADGSVASDDADADEGLARGDIYNLSDDGAKGAAP